MTGTPRSASENRLAIFCSRVLQALTLSILSVFAISASAQAQNIDWLVNIDDTGFDPSPAGGVIDYVVEIDNNGFQPAPATTVNFDAPANTSLVGITGDFTNCQIGGSAASYPAAGPVTVTCDIAALPATTTSANNASAIVQVQTTQAGVIVPGASVPTANDDLPANNTLTEQTTITAGTDLGIQLSGPASVASGDFVDMDIDVTNNGPNTANSYRIEFPVPTGLANLQLPSGCFNSGGTIICNISSSLNVGSTFTRTIRAQVSAGGGQITGSSSVNNVNPGDPISANNTDTLTFDVDPGTDVSIDIAQSGGSPLLVGDTTNFTIQSAYTGGNPQALEITTTIPANYTIDNINTTNGWACLQAPGTQDVTCTLSSGSGAGANVDLGDIVIETTVVSAGSPSVIADISIGSPAETNFTNNSDSVTRTILQPTVDLRANKSGPNPALAVVGQNYSFGLSTTNIGNADFFGTIEMTDTVPAGMTVNSLSLNGWTYAGGFPVVGPAPITVTRDYTSGSPLGENATTPGVTVNTTITAAGTLNNTLVVGSPNSNIPDTNSPNNTTSYSVGAAAPGGSADVSILKRRSLATLPVGDVQTFEIEIVNTGPATSNDVRMVDNFTSLMNGSSGATGSGFVGFSIDPRGATGVTCPTSNSTGGSSWRLGCTVSSLPVCTPGVDCPIITAQIRPGGNAGSRTNTATATSFATPDPDISTASNSASVSYNVTAVADITVSKSANPDPAVAGQDVTFIVTARNLNTGLSRADSVVITDDLPDDMTFVSATPSSGTCSTQPTPGSTTSSSQVICSVGNIGVNSQRTLTIVARPNNATRGTTITNDVAVTTTTVETDLTNNDADVSVSVTDPDLDILINKDDSVDPVTIGETTVYTLTVTNAGPSSSENVVVTDVMPDSIFAYRSHTVSGAGTCSTVPVVAASPPANAADRTLECTFPYLAEGASEVITITAEATAKGTIPNTVSISSDEIVAGFDRESVNNSTDETTTSRTRADLRVVKTASTDPVNLRETFNFEIALTNLAGAGLFEADGVELSDTLPADMELTGTPSAIITGGSSTSNSCTGAAGGMSFTCDFGTLDNGAVATVTVPVRIVDVNALPQTFVNTASVTTSSFDPDTSNNSDTASVSVNSSSLAGTIYFDFNNSATAAVPGQDLPQDAGISGVCVDLTGTAFDGTTITASTTTDANGDYSFPFLPQGTYTVTRCPISDPANDFGQSSVGSEGGTLGGATVQSSIALPSNTAATDYDFAEIPQARVGLSKQLLGSPDINADGSFNATFRLVAENFSQEPLDNVEITDALQGAAPLFGTYQTVSNTVTDPMANGTYLILSTPTGSCGGLNGSFNGAGAQTLATGFGLAIGGTCTVDFTLRIKPTDPLPPVLASGGRYENQAVITARGALSGQLPTGPNANPGLIDPSQDGTDADPNGNDDPSDNNDPTPVIPVYNPQIALIKTADVSALSSPSAAAGETITYSFRIENTGDVTLSNITLVENLIGATVTGGPIASLAPGDFDDTTFTATYDLLQTDVDADQVINSATTSGTDPYGTVVTDDSGTTNGDDTPLITPLVPTPRVTLVKEADTSGFSDPPQVGDPITYTFTVRNAGNVTLNNVTVTDTSLPGLVLSGAPIPTMAPTGPTSIDTVTYTATYALTQQDIINGAVSNTALVTGTPPSGPDVTDTSGTDQTNDDPTDVPVAQAPSITLDKIVDDSATREGALPGDQLTFDFTITNTGNLPLNNVTVTDTLPGVVLSGGPIPVLNPGDIDTTTYTATYTITQTDIDAGEVINVATVEGFYGPGGTLSVTDEDTETGGVGNIEAISEVFPPFTTDGGTTSICILASDLLNNSPATLNDVAIRVLRADPGVTLEPDNCGITLAPGFPAGEYEIEYEISSLTNPGLTDTTTETVVQSALPGIEVTKTQVFEDNGDGRQDIGDTLNYTITVENTGNTPLENVVLTDTPFDLNGQALTLTSGPTWQSADAGSPDGMLEIGEMATYVASLVVNQQAVNSTGVENTAQATALPVYEPGVPGTPTPIDDVSDNGVDTDGNDEDDPTIFRFDPSAVLEGLSIAKTTTRDVVRRGEVVPYEITVTNDNTFRAGPFNLQDTLPTGFIYVPGSSSLPGAISTGGRITWPGVVIPANDTLVVTLSARILTGANAGEHVNLARLLDPTGGGDVAPPATATVRILPEAVFDCGDVIGRVFEDHNANGYQDDPNAPSKGITDQTVAGKLGKPLKAPDLTEKGIPDVRLVGVDGTIITTDANGLFSVPCAMLPADRGSNFILKVDTRSLPSGYRMTTENPRVMRLTPGMMTEMNFGAAIGRVVRVDLGAAAFGTDGRNVTLSQPLKAGIAQLLPRIAGEAANLRLAFHVSANAGKDEVNAAHRMMRATEKYLKSEWRKVGRTRLIVEKTIVRAGE